MGKAGFLYTLRASSWLPSVTPALLKAAMCRSGWSSFLRTMCKMLLRVSWAFLSMVVHVNGVSDFCWPVLQFMTVGQMPLPLAAGFMLIALL